MVNTTKADIHIRYWCICEEEDAGKMLVMIWKQTDMGYALP